MPESLVKRHAEGVTHNTIGSVISTYIVQGVPLLISWLIAHLASLQGLPLYAVILLFLGAFALVTLALNQGRQLLRGRQSQLQGTSAALDSPGGQSDSDKALIESQAHAGKLEQALNVARAHNEEYEWLVAIAKGQQESIERYIQTDCWITDHSLVEEPLFIDFRFSFQSSSLYKLTATGLSGSIRVGNRRLGNATPNIYPPRIESNELQELAIGETGYLTITQPLTRADAVSVLGGADFMFDGLSVELETMPSTGRTVKLNPKVTTQNELRDKYPKLKIEFKRAVYSYIPLPDRRGGDFPETVSFDITFDVTLENLRNTKIEIESVQVSLVNLNQPTYRLEPDTGEIYERRFINDKGVFCVMGDKLKNLVSSPLSIIGRGKVSGCFQFTLENVPIGAVKAEDTTASLVLTDKYGEHHVGNHDLERPLN